MRTFSILACATLVSASLCAHADVVYDYTGNYFTTLTNDHGPGYTTSDRVTGSVTLSHALAPLTQYNPGISGFSVLSFSFSDGIQTITNLDFTNPQFLSEDYFFFNTDASDNIYAWSVVLHVPVNNDTSYDQIGSTRLGDLAGVVEPNFAYSTARGPAKGSWSLQSTVPPAVTPEPSGFVLLGTGALGLVGAMRRRLA